MDSDENGAPEKSDCAHKQTIDILEENNIKLQNYNTINGRKSKHIHKSR